MRQIVEHLGRSFRTDAVNLLCLHTHVEGAIKGTSERQVHLGDDWAALPSTFPSNAHYIALGHIHRPQKINAPSPAYYAGSPLQMDFGEAGEEKSFLVVEAAAGPRPAQISVVPYVGGTPLKEVRGVLKELAEQAADLRDDGWLRVTVDLDDHDPDINRRVRELLPNAVSVDAIVKKSATPAATIAETSLPADAFRQYYRETHGEDASDALIDAFIELREVVEAEECAQ
jgi:exonuclease SbcD